MQYRLLRKALLGLTLVLGTAVAVALVNAPYLPQLLVEGYPELVGPVRGHVVPVAGAAPARDLDPAAPTALRPELQTLFAKSDGRALLVFHDGKLLIEHYAPGVTAETPLNSYSMAKSLVGALVYKALAEGRLASLDLSLGEVLPELRDDAVAGVTLRALLTMQSGIVFETGSKKFGGVDGTKDLEATATNPFGPLARLHFLGLRSIEHELSADGTAAFNYQNVNTALLGAVLSHIYGQSLPELLAEKIWQPAGAATAAWLQPSREGEVAAYCCIFATARDWIRVGAYLNATGTPDAPFLPTALWREFLGLDLPRGDIARGHYGQHVWQDVLDRPGQQLQGPFSYFFGQNGQLLYLMPEHDLVVYRAGERMQLLHSTLYGAWNTALESASR